MSDYSNVTGIVEYWTLHIISLSEQDRTEFNDIMPDSIPAIMTAQVVLDGRSRFAPGTAMMSSLLKGFDLQNMMVVTENSIYSLKGPGDILIRDAQPVAYDIEVGATIVRLSGLITDKPH